MGETWGQVKIGPVLHWVGNIPKVYLRLSNVLAMASSGISCPRKVQKELFETEPKFTQ